MKVRTDRFPRRNYKPPITLNKWYDVVETRQPNSDGVPRIGVIINDLGMPMVIVLDGPCDHLDLGYWDVDWYE